MTSSVDTSLQHLSVLDSAREWLRRGYHPIPISLETKRPNRHGWPALRLTADQLPEYFHDGVNVGVLLGDEEGHSDVDMDCHEAIQAGKWLLPETGITFGRDSKPRSHCFYICSPGTVTKQFKDPFTREMIVELRSRTKKGSCSQSVVPYSIHASRELVRFERGCSGETATIQGNDLQAAVARVAAAALLAKYWPEAGRNETELALSGALAHAGWGVEDAIHFVLAVYTAVKSYDPNALDRVQNSVRATFDAHERGESVTGTPSLKSHVHADAVDTAYKWLGVAADVESTAVAVIPANEPWRAELVLARGSVLPILANVATTLRNAAEWKGTIGYDEFACKAVFVKDAPAHSECVKGPIEDQQVLWITEVMQHADYPAIGKQTTLDAVYAVAMEKGRRFHPVRDYLNKLPAWDEVKRLDKWLHTYLGASDNEISRIIGPKFLVMMVARILHPGCKADYALILESPQGELKSSSLRDGLMPDPKWFTDQLPDLGSKDAALQIQGIWLVEAAEMDAMSKAEVNRIKAFLTSPVDRLRPPYGRIAIDFPRQCVFAGSTNKRQYLRDETGARRFWPVPVGSWGVGLINIDALAKDRDQLWAEALFRYHAKERWWPTKAEEDLLKVEQAARYEEPAWTDYVMSWCDDPQSKATQWDEDQQRAVPIEIISTPERVALAEILVHALSKPIGTLRRADEMTVANILTSKGWDRKKKRIQGSDKWVYVRPDEHKQSNPRLSVKRASEPPQASFEGLDDLAAAKDAC